jgi:hypothetical protein
MNNTTTTKSAVLARNSAVVEIASQELQRRIRAKKFVEAFTELACDLCLEQVPAEEAFARIQDRAMEKMVAMLDTEILGNDAATKRCLEVVVEESERVAWEALEKGSEVLKRGLDILDGVESLEDLGPVN